MRIGTLFLAAIASAMLVGCGSPRSIKLGDLQYIPNPAKTQPCAAQSCSLSVTVEVDPVTHACTPVVDDLDVSGGVAGQRDLVWNLATTGYEFSKESFKYGIFIKNDPDDDFKNAVISNGGKTLTLKFDHKNPGYNYAYALTVRRSSNQSFCKTLDPWLIS